MITFRREPRPLCCRKQGDTNIIVNLIDMWICVRCLADIFICSWVHTYIHQPPAQVVLPVLSWGHLRNEHPVCTAGQSRHQSQVPAAEINLCVSYIWLSFRLSYFLNIFSFFEYLFVKNFNKVLMTQYFEKFLHFIYDILKLEKKIACIVLIDGSVRYRWLKLLGGCFAGMGQ